MALEYLPIMAQAGAPKPPRVLVSPSKPAWRRITKPLSQSRVALLTSAALRLADQHHFHVQRRVSGSLGQPVGRYVARPDLLHRFLRQPRVACNAEARREPAVRAARYSVVKFRLRIICHAVRLPVAARPALA